MGRYYGGTITGKWAFGLLSSATPDKFHPDGTNRKNYRCPYGNQDTGDDTDFSDSEMPEDLENDADWTDEQRDFMDIHRECMAAKEMKCNNEREDEMCYDFDHDEYCRTFKIKSKSKLLFYKLKLDKGFCTLDDFSKLYVDRDLDRILELLPDYIKS